MSYETRKIVYNGAVGFLAGFGIRRMYDLYNTRKMIETYNRTGELPRKKSVGVAILLACLFGSFGLFYSSPRVAVPLLIIDFPLMIFLFFSLILRPIVVLIAIGATISHNSIAKQLFGVYRGGLL